VYNLQWADPSISGPPCIVCQCAHFMDAGAASLSPQSPLVSPVWHEFPLHLEDAANECHSSAFDEGARMARLQQHGHKMQHQRFASVVAGKKTCGINRGCLPACLTPGGREFDHDPALRFLGRLPKTDAGGCKRVVVRPRPGKPDRQITVVYAASGRGADRAAQDLP